MSLISSLPYEPINRKSSKFYYLARLKKQYLNKDHCETFLVSRFDTVADIYKAYDNQEFQKPIKYRGDTYFYKLIGFKKIFNKKKEGINEK
jgi:hypothetical protein